MDKEKTLHDLTIAYLLYQNITTDAMPLTLEQFYQEYDKLTFEFKPIIDHYNQ